MPITQESTILYIKEKEQYATIVAALAETIDKRDILIGCHSKAVQKYSLMIGEYLKLSEKDRIRLEFSSILHDIGKIGIPDKVLKKSSSLTVEEFETMKEHPLFGVDILRHIPALEDIIPGIRHHHEYYDGTGYPDGLKGKDIDIIARIIAIADAFDVMVSGRVYQTKVSYSDALGEMQRCSGSQFDPDIAGLFVQSFPYCLY